MPLQTAHPAARPIHNSSRPGQAELAARTAHQTYKVRQALPILVAATELKNNIQLPAHVHPNTPIPAPTASELLQTQGQAQSSADKPQLHSSTVDAEHKHSLEHRLPEQPELADH